MTDFSLLLLSGGVGRRSCSREPKQFYELAGHPLIAHTIMTIKNIENISEIIVNAPPQFEERTNGLMLKYCKAIPFKVIAAGETRQESTHLLVQNASYENVLLHEAARPFATTHMFEDLIAHPKKNVGYFAAISFSMCQVSSKKLKVKKGISRETVFDIQLPQKFSRKTLLRAHEAATAAGESYNEDSLLVTERAGKTVYAMSGNSKNFKVTNPEDFAIAEEILRRAQ